MRTHRAWPVLQMWNDVTLLKSHVCPEKLCVVVMESVRFRGRAAALLSLQFMDESNIVVPGCIVDLDARTSGLRDTLIWPSAVAGIVGDARLKAIEDMIKPWIDAECMGEIFYGERTRNFGHAEAAALFADAQEQRFFGAASLASMRNELAPLLYARRFIGGEPLACTGDAAFLAAALYAPAAAAVALPGAGERQLAVAQRWFGRTFATRLPPGLAASVLITSTGTDDISRTELRRDALRVTLDGSGPGESVSWGPSALLDELALFGEDRPGARRMTIACSSNEGAPWIFGPPQKVGGSGGRVLFVLRMESYVTGGEDVREARRLAVLLEDEGIDVAFTVDPDGVDVTNFDLIHIHGLIDADASSKLLERAKAARVPTILTPHFEDVADGGYWGMFALRSCFDSIIDEGRIENMLPIIAQRNVTVNDVVASSRFDYGRDAARKAALRSADLIVAANEAERDAIERFAKRKHRIGVAGSLVYSKASDVDVRALLPNTDFLLVHAAIDDRANLWMATRAAADLNLPLVVAGEIADRALYRGLATVAGSATVFLPGLSDEQIDAVYARARVFVDVAWVGEGAARCMRAALSGARIVVSDRRLLDARLDDVVTKVDPASMVSIRSGLSAAWTAADERQDPVKRFGETVLRKWSPAYVLRETMKIYASAAERTQDHFATSE